MFVRARTLLLLPACLLAFAQPAVSGPGDPEYIPAEGELPVILEVSAVKRRISHVEPWRGQSFYRARCIAFPISDELVLAVGLDVRNAVSFIVKDLSDGRRQAAALVAGDSELNLAVLKVSPARKLKSEPIKIVDNPALIAKLKEVRGIGLMRRKTGIKIVERTLFVKGFSAVASPGGASRIPAVLFSSWEPGISRGDILLVGNTLIGIVIDFDSTTRHGHAVPGVFVQQFLTAFRAGRGGAGDLIIEGDKKTKKPTTRVLDVKMNI